MTSATAYRADLRLTTVVPAAGWPGPAVTAGELDQLAASQLDKVTTARTRIAGLINLILVYSISRYEAGALRAVMNVLHNASIACFDADEPITSDVLRAAAYNLGLGHFETVKAVPRG